MKNGQISEVLVYKLESADYACLDKERQAAARFLLPELEKIIEPGQRVVIKPNWVKESHVYKRDEWEYVITHPDVIKLVLEKVIECLKGKGEICIVDAPQTDSDYGKIIQNTGFEGLVSELQKTTAAKISYFDLREELWHCKQGIILKRKKLKGDPDGYVQVNLKENSAFCGKANKEYYGADCDMDETRRYHNEKDNIYVISKTVLGADVFINMPKLKTHKLAGITCCLKNLVGICVIKNSIPHHTWGYPETGGDKFPQASKKRDSESRLKGLALKLLKKNNPLINYPLVLIKKLAGLVFGGPQSDVIRNGAWHGNDTIWRSILDLNKILIYADKDGNMRNEPQRKYFAVVDGIIAGEGKGPMEPDPKPAGILMAGGNPASVDAVAATLMGYDYAKIPSIKNAFECNVNVGYPIVCSGTDAIAIRSNDGKLKTKISEYTRAETLQFRPHPGWQNNIEMNY